MFRTIRDAPLRVRRRPAAPGAPEIAFVPALGTGLWAWEGVADRLPPDWGLTLYDLRGQGLSGGTGPRMADHAADLLALAPEGSVVCGLSIGGQIAMSAALNAPGRLRALVLADTAPRIGTAFYYAERAARIRAEGMVPFAGDQVRRWFAPGLDPDLVQGAEAALAAQPVEGYLAACEAIAACDLTAETSRLAVPVLCLGGSEDISTPPETIRALAAAIPGASCEIVGGAGHLPPVEAPAVLADTIARFVRSVHSTP